MCVQPRPQPGSIYSWDLRPMSEDCLSLNIWAPTGARNAPVFFWIHGGALSSGDGQRWVVQDGAALATRGLVVVSINYRLGVLGFLAHPQLSAESSRERLRQLRAAGPIAALALGEPQHRRVWRRPCECHNRGRVGGRAECHVPHGGTARRAACSPRPIAQSASMVSAPELRTTTFGGVAAEWAGLSLAQKAGAADLAGLRAMDAQALTAVAASTGFFPFFVIDGRVLTRQIVDVFDRGEQAKVPVLAGFNSGNPLAPQPDAAAGGGCRGV